MRAHLLGGVPVAEITNKRPLFDALHFNPAHAFSPCKQGSKYQDFAPTLPDRASIRTLVENNSGVQACLVTVRKDLAAWWTEHSPRLAELPKTRALNRVRTDLLESFVAALLKPKTRTGIPPLDRFKLAGVIATWWTDTLPDFKTLLENGFHGVIDGWVDAIADAAEDDEAAGPLVDPFAHKLVRRIMTDYLERIAAAKADIACFKGQKEDFEQSNATDDLEEDELAAWNHAKELERQIRELKAENRQALRQLSKLENAAIKKAATPADQAAHRKAAAELAPTTKQLAACEHALVPYADIKDKLTEARALYRTLTAEFVNELKSRCDALNTGSRRTLVLELFVQDVQAGLDASLADKRQELVRFIERVWDKYRSMLSQIKVRRSTSEATFRKSLENMRYV